MSPGRAGRHAASSSVAPIASSYGRSLRPRIALAHRTPGTNTHHVRSSGSRKGRGFVLVQRPQILAEAHALVVDPERVAHPVALGAQIAEVLSIGPRLDRLLGDDCQAEALDAGDLLRVVRQDTDGRQS